MTPLRFSASAVGNDINPFSLQAPPFPCNLLRPLPVDVHIRVLEDNGTVSIVDGISCRSWSEQQPADEIDFCVEAVLLSWVIHAHGLNGNSFAERASPGSAITILPAERPGGHFLSQHQPSV